jgi:hypothetical protein
LYAYVRGAELVHVPVLTVNPEPSRAVPDRLGATVLAGGLVALTTTEVGDESAEPEPTEFVAVTSTRTAWPASAEVRTYV